MTNQETYADKIAKLLRKAESTTPEEAELLYAKAQELMTKYAIDEAMVAAARGGQRTSDPLVKEEFVIVGIYRFPLMRLAFYVLINNDIKCLKLGGKNWRKIDGKLYKETEVLIGVGYKSDIDRARALQTSLMLQAMVAENHWWKEFGHAYKNEAKGGHYARRQYLFSFAQGVQEKLREATARGRAAAEKEHSANSVALALRDKSLVVQDEFEKHFPQTRKTKSSFRAGDDFASSEGHAAGRRADVGQPGVGGTRKGIGR